MRSPAAALLVCLLAGSACSSGSPESRATAATDSPGTTTTATVVAPATTVTATELAPTSTVTEPSTAPSTAPVTEATVAPTTQPTPAPTTPTVPIAVAVPIDTTNLTTPPPIEDLDDGEHVGIVESTDNGTIEFDRVEPIDANGDGTDDAYQNDNPRQRSVPLPDHVLLDGQVVDRATAASRLGGLTVLVRLTIVGQRLAAVDQLTVPI